MADQKNYDGLERRSFKRISFSFPVRFKQFERDKEGGERDNITQYAYSNDIGMEGMKLKFLENVEEGKHLKLKLTLPMEQGCVVVHATGEVIWSHFDNQDKIYIVGVNFLDMDADNKRKLNQFIEISLEEAPVFSPPESQPSVYVPPEKIIEKIKRPIRVLVVDDEQNVRYLLNLKLAMKKMFIVEQAAESKEVFEKIQLAKPDIILLDIMLPGVDGYQICREIKESPDMQDISIIFLTARSQVKDVIHGLRVGVDDYITKPYEFEDLYYQMMKVIEAKKSI